MRLKPFILLLFVSNFSFAQQPLTGTQISRLADAGKVYGYIKYFHPYLQYKNINWDSAFAANVEGIIHARNKEQYATVMLQLLSSLGDNLTTVINATKEDTTYHLQFTTYNIKDSILYVNMNDAPAYAPGNPDNSYDRVEAALQNITRVKGVIFDMRKPVNSKYNNEISAGQFLDWSTSFFKGDVFMPSFRTISYLGLYEVFFKETMHLKVKGNAKKEVPLVFIVENEEQIPLLATALQEKGKAAIIQEKSSELFPGKSISFYIHDRILIRMRISDAINASGSLLMVHPNATYLSNENSAAALSTAEQMILNGITNYSTFTQAVPLVESHVADYTNENSYPILGYRFLAAAKIFSAIDLFFPNKKIMDKNWEESYKAIIPKFIEAKDSLQYMRAVAEFYANINDSHGFISKANDGFSLRLNPIIQGRGSFIPPVFTGVIENKVIVTSIYNDSVCRSVGISKGDVILSINGEDPMKQIEEVRKYQPASNKTSQTFFICNFILFGKEGQVMKLKVKGANGKIKDVSLPTLREFNGSFLSDDYVLKFYSGHDKPTFNRITKDIGYADVTSPMQERDFDSMFILFKNSKAIIFDMRGYPHSYINPEKFAKNPDAIIAKFSTPAPSSPNVRGISYQVLQAEDNHVFYQSLNFSTGGWVYPGKVIMLINEVPQSAAEHVCLMLKALCNATFIGSPTAGANGGLTNFNIPGNITLWFSGENVSYPNGKPMQRVGLQPDINVRPTIKGIQAGRDEVLERAIKFAETGK